MEFKFNHLAQRLPEAVGIDMREYIRVLVRAQTLIIEKGTVSEVLEEICKIPDKNEAILTAFLAGVTVGRVGDTHE